MFDFLATLHYADELAVSGKFSLAIFHYWLIDFAFEDEEIPFGYTKEIGNKAYRNYKRLMKKHSEKILEDESYIQFKENTKCFETYQNYFFFFEKAVNSYNSYHEYKKKLRQNNKSRKSSVNTPLDAPYGSKDDISPF